MNFQVSYYPGLQLITRSRDLYPIVKQTWLEDKVYQQFGIESEDYCNIKGIEKNSEFIAAAGTLQTLIESDIMEYVPETEIYQEPILPVKFFFFLT
jgi:hypothetical protein